MSRAKRLDAQGSKGAALEAAEAILLAEGAPAVTLQAVAKRIGRTHGNLLHHFGSAAGLQRALAERIGARVAVSIGDAIARRRRGEASPRDIVDALFDAFEREHVGELIGWVVVTHQRAVLSQIDSTLAEIVAAYADVEPFVPIRRIALGLTLLAVGDSLVGQEVRRATGLDRAEVREQAVALIESLLRSQAPSGPTVRP